MSFKFATKILPHLKRIAALPRKTVVLKLHHRNIYVSDENEILIKTLYQLKLQRI